MAVATQRHMTLEAYLTYDDGTDTRYELVDGILVAMGAESTINTQIASFLFALFLGLGIPAYRIGFKQKIAVLSRSVTARDPDLIIHSEASVQAIDGAKEACLRLEYPHPVLLIEVVSPGNEDSENYQRDYIEKPREYADRGIPEFWIVDPMRSVVLVGTLKDGAYEFVGFRGDESIGSPTFSPLNLTANQVLSAGR